jgi:hypothetical protein
MKAFRRGRVVGPLTFSVCSRWRQMVYVTLYPPPPDTTSLPLQSFNRRLDGPQRRF